MLMMAMVMVMAKVLVLLCCCSSMIPTLFENLWSNSSRTIGTMSLANALAGTRTTSCIFTSANMAVWDGDGDSESDHDGNAGAETQLCS